MIVRYNWEVYLDNGLARLQSMLSWFTAMNCVSLTCFDSLGKKNTAPKNKFVSIEQFATLVTFTELNKLDTQKY